MADDEVPADLTGAGLALWNELHADLEFQPHERQLVVELCRTVTVCEMLSKELAVLGPVIEGQRGWRVSPILAELRQQRLVVARLVHTIGIPEPDGIDRPRHRGSVRGVYLKGAK